MISTGNELPPAIVVGGYTMALGVVRALGQMGVPITVVHYDDAAIAQCSRYITKSVRAPHPEEYEAEFAQCLLELAKELPGAVLFPASDAALVGIARNKSALEAYFVVACPDWNVARQFICKQYTYALAEANDVPVPKTFVPGSLKEAVTAAEEIGLPCLVKPCESHRFCRRFGSKMVAVSNTEELTAAFSRSAAAGIEVMIQEIVAGGDDQVVNYNAYFCDNVPLVEFTARHVRNGPPFWGSPRVVVSEDIPALLEPGRAILRALGFSGYACVEFKNDPRTGDLKLIEVNGRHNLSTLLAVRCGINFPWVHYKHLTENELPQVGNSQSGVYWIDVVRDIGYSLSFLREECYAPSQYLKPYFAPHICAIADWRDPAPFYRRLRGLLSQGGKRLGLRVRKRHSRSAPD